MADPQGDLLAALVTRLSANAGLTTMGVTANGWWENTAPAGTAVPHGVIRFLSGGDTNTSPRRDKRWRVIIAVMGVSQNEARLGKSYIDDELHKTELIISGWSNYRCLADDDFTQDDHFEGKQVYLRGEIFGLWMDKNS